MLAILTTHPIQYQVPLWQALARDARVPFEVWYLTSHATRPARDLEFGKEFAWDLDMLAGYPHKFLDVAPGATPNSFWNCRLKEKLRDRLRASGARALWIQGWQVAAYWQAVSEAKAAGVEVWLRGESNDLAPTPLWKLPAKRMALHWLFKRVDRFLYVGSANKRLYQKFGVPNEKLSPAPYAVDNARFAEQAAKLRGQRTEISGSQGANFTAGGREHFANRPREAGDSVLVKTERQQIRAEWRIPEDAFVVLFCGKFIPKKRPMDLIAAAERLLSREPGAGGGGSAQDPALPAPRSQLHLLFAGSGELGGEMRAACNVVFDAERSVVGGRVVSSRSPTASFAGFLNQTEVSRAYVAADVLVLPSDYSETWGLVVNEAMASGLPCIVSDRCGCAEDLGKAPSNAVYKCGDIKQLTALLTDFEKQPRRESSPDWLKSYSLDETVQTIAGLWQN